jgi:hypothetical protein
MKAIFANAWAVAVVMRLIIPPESFESTRLEIFCLL